jgi:hypothetical protein
MDSNGNTILHMLVICNLPDIYAKYKARWIEQQTIQSFSHMKNEKLTRKKSIALSRTQSIDFSTTKAIEFSKLWSRLNNDGLTPLTLAANLGRTSMLSWLLHERKIIQWSYGDVTCVLHPLDQLDLGFHEEASQYKFKFIYVYILIYSGCPTTSVCT